MTPAILALTAQLLDLSSWTLALRAKGIGGESNPLAVTIGFPAMVALKLGGALLACLIAHWLSHRPFERHPRLAGVVWYPAALGLFGALTNVLALW